MSYPLVLGKAKQLCMQLYNDVQLKNNKGEIITTVGHLCLPQLGDNLHVTETRSLKKKEQGCKVENTIAGILSLKEKNMKIDQGHIYPFSGNKI